MAHTPNVEPQRAAMKKLGFLVGKWSGEVRRELFGSESIGWGFALGEIKTSSVLRKLTIGERPPQKLINLRVRRLSL